MKKNRAALFGISVILALLGLGSWFLIEKSVDPIGNELTQVTAKILGFNGDDPEEDLRALMAINIDNKTLPNATYLASRLLTIERPPGPRSPMAPPAGPAWQALKEKSNPIVQLRMDQFESTASWSGLSRYLLDLYEQDFGKTRDSLQYLITYRAYLPYASLVVAQALAEKIGIDLSFHAGQELSQKEKDGLKKLLAQNAFIEWARAKTFNLRQYAGSANPTLGVYDWITYPEYAKRVGVDRFRKDANIYFDLGGGYETPDISHLLGHKFISLDIVAPRSARSLDLLFFGLDSWQKPSLYTRTIHTLSASDREVYLEKLDKTQFHRFNIFEDSFSPKYQSYFFTSFGFLGSTIGYHSQKAAYMQNNSVPKIFATTYVGMRRILELVAQGKDVDLFAVLGNPYRLFRFQTAYLSFRDHHLVDEKFLPRDLEAPEGTLKRVPRKAR